MWHHSAVSAGWFDDQGRRVESADGTARYEPRTQIKPRHLLVVGLVLVTLSAVWFGIRNPWAGLATGVILAMLLLGIYALTRGPA